MECLGDTKQQHKHKQPGTAKISCVPAPPQRAPLEGVGGRGGSLKISKTWGKALKKEDSVKNLSFLLVLDNF